MKRSRFLAPLVLAAGCAVPPEQLPAFPPELRQQVLRERNVAASWDEGLLAEDLEALTAMKEVGTLGPFAYGAFPVPDYDRIGDSSFRGVGSLFLPGVGEYVGSVDDKQIVGAALYTRKNPWNESRIGDADAHHFFQILVLTDFIDADKFTHFRSQIVSRNHPDTIGQGLVRTTQSRVDFCAFATAEGPAYAVVNMRLFDLAHGTTILVAPQQDGTLRSLQLVTDAPSTEGDGWLSWTRRTLERPDVRAFFLAPGNI